METLLPLIVGIVLTFAIQWAKKLNIPTVWLLAGGSILVGVLYAVYLNVVPKESQVIMLNLAQTSAFYSVLIYEVLFKAFKTKEGK